MGLKGEGWLLPEALSHQKPELKAQLRFQKEVFLSF